QGRRGSRGTGRRAPRCRLTGSPGLRRCVRRWPRLPYHGLRMTRPPIFESYSNELPPPGRDAPPVRAPAVFGLLVLLLQCLPVISGLGAILLGSLGLAEIRRRERIGRPIALAAIILGGISVVAWVVILTFG